MGYRGEARRNPWLAAQRLLEHFNISTKDVRALPEFRDLPHTATVIIPESHHTITDSLRESLIAWVEQGGYLIVEAEYAGIEDPLVSGFGVRRQETEFDEVEEENDESEYETFALPGATGETTVVFDTYMTLAAENPWFQLDGMYGTYALIVQRGEGAAVIVNDLDYLRNNMIGSHDHAQFLLDLLRAREHAAAAGTMPKSESAE